MTFLCVCVSVNSPGLCLVDFFFLPAGNVLRDEIKYIFI